MTVTRVEDDFDEVEKAATERSFWEDWYEIHPDARHEMSP